MSAVRIPPVLRTATGGQKQVEIGGATVGEVLTSLATTDPGLSTQLLSEDGQLNRFVNVYLNDTDVRHLQALSTRVAERDTILLLPAMAGGSRDWTISGPRQSSCACPSWCPCACPSRARAR